MGKGAISIEFDCSDFIKNLEKIDKKIRGEVARKAVDAGGHQVMDYARLNIRQKLNKHPRGHLANSITVTSKNTGSGAVAEVKPNREYARIHEFGGTIVPRKARMLYWRDPDTGELRAAKRVTIPARPYLRPAVEDHKEEIIAAMREVIEKELHS